MLPEVCPVLMNLAIGLPLATSALLILCIDLGTELAPAVSLAYEKSESDVMSRPPRNAKTDRLVTRRAVLYIAIAGSIETLTCWLAYFLVFHYYSIGPDELVNVSNNYFTGTVSSDSEPWNGKHASLSATSQEDYLAQAQTAYWICLTGTQVVHIFLCKTRCITIFEHGIFNNLVMNYGVLVEIGLIIIIVFVPWLNTILLTNPSFPGKYWALVLISHLALFIYSEPRKYFARKFPNSVINRYLMF